ncbi:MAG: rhodanese-like domain-containing protein [Labilithrix sp.]|nr:rhodanese-like domain-containing protein [Labilithrix sp.]
MRISPQEAHAKMTGEGVAYVDVRTEEEFEAGHPQGAFNVPLMRAGANGMEPNDDFLRVMETSFEKNAPLIVGCKMGGRSARAAEMLAAAGFANVLDQRAGWDGARGSFGELTEPGWSRAKLPAEHGAEGPRAYASLRAALTKP